MASALRPGLHVRQGSEDLSPRKEPSALHPTPSSVPSRKVAIAVAMCVALLIVAALALGSGSGGSPGEVGVTAAAPDKGNGPGVDAPVVDPGAEGGDTTVVDETTTTSEEDQGRRVTAEAVSGDVPATTARPSTTRVRAAAVEPAPKPRPTTTTTRRATTTTTRPKPKPSTTTTTARPRPTEEGDASWYGAAPAGTCAHKSLPMGTIVTVTNRDNGRTATCRVADRGPYTDGRIIDLAKDVFAQLADPAEGVFPARISW